MILSATGLWLRPSEGVVAWVICDTSINLKEEDTLRVMLENFYTKKNPPFARLAIRVEEKKIFFRSKPNCKRPPNDEEVIVILKAINCYPREILTGTQLKKSPSQADFIPSGSLAIA